MCSEIHLVLGRPIYKNHISASALQTVEGLWRQGTTTADLKKTAGDSRRRASPGQGDSWVGGDELQPGQTHAAKLSGQEHRQEISR